MELINNINKTLRDDIVAQMKVGSRLSIAASCFSIYAFQVWNDSDRLQVVTEEVIDSISNAYKENAPEFLYFVALYNIFNEFLEDER